MLTAAEWEVVRQVVRLAADCRCDICGVEAQAPLECHATWEYNADRLLQKLVRMAALCASCHLVNHIGHADGAGRAAEAKRHLAAVNRWSAAYVDQYVTRVFDVWSWRSEEEWTVDLSALAKYGVPSPGVLEPLLRYTEFHSWDRFHPDGTRCSRPQFLDDTTTADGEPWWPLVADVGRCGVGSRNTDPLLDQCPVPDEEVGCWPP